MNWKAISDIDHIDQIIKESFKKAQVIFKHSTSCSISSMAKMRLQDKLHDIIAEIDLHYLDLIQFRNISNHIAEKFQVNHESPQLILIKDGEAEYDASHFDISIDELNESLTFIYG